MDSHDINNIHGIILKKLFGGVDFSNIEKLLKCLTEHIDKNTNFKILINKYTHLIWKIVEDMFMLNDKYPCTEMDEVIHEYEQDFGIKIYKREKANAIYKLTNISTITSTKKINFPYFIVIYEKYDFLETIDLEPKNSKNTHIKKYTIDNWEISFFSTEQTIEFKYNGKTLMYDFIDLMSNIFYKYTNDIEYIPKYFMFNSLDKYVVDNKITPITWQVMQKYAADNISLKYIYDNEKIVYLILFLNYGTEQYSLYEWNLSHLTLVSMKKKTSELFHKKYTNEEELVDVKVAIAIKRNDKYKIIDKNIDEKDINDIINNVSSNMLSINRKYSSVNKWMDVDVDNVKSILYFTDNNVYIEDKYIKLSVVYDTHKLRYKLCTKDGHDTDTFIDLDDSVKISILKYKNKNVELLKNKNNLYYIIGETKDAHTRFELVNNLSMNCLHKKLGQNYIPAIEFIMEALYQFIIEKYAIDDNFVVNNYAQNIYDKILLFNNELQSTINVYKDFGCFSHIYVYGNNYRIHEDLTKFYNTDSGPISSLFDINTQSQFRKLSEINIVEDLSDNKINVNSLRRIPSYYPGTCDLILVENNINYFDTIHKLDYFNEFCDSALTSNGKLIISFFDINKLKSFDNLNLNVTGTIIDLKIDDLLGIDIDYLKPAIITNIELFYNQLENILDEEEEKHIISNLDTNNYELPNENIYNCELYDIKQFIKYHVLCNNYQNKKFVSKKLITKNQTNLLHTLFEIDFELLSNAYDHTFDYTSIYTVDELYDSKGFPLDFIKNDDNIKGRNVLIENSEIYEDVVKYINSYRLKSDYNTIIINDKDISKSIKRKIETIKINDNYVHIVFGKLYEHKKDIIMRLFNNYFLNDIALIQKFNILGCNQYTMSKDYVKLFDKFNIIYSDFYPYLSMAVATHLSRQKHLYNVVNADNEKLYSAFTFVILSKK